MSDVQRALDYLNSFVGAFELLIAVAKSKNENKSPTLPFEEDPTLTLTFRAAVLLLRNNYNRRTLHWMLHS